MFGTSMLHMAALSRMEQWVLTSAGQVTQADPLLVLVCMFCVEWRAGHRTTDFMAHC